jgi:5'-nucleotidase
MVKTNFWKTATLFLVLAILLSAFPAAAVAQQPKVNFWLTVLHNNDGESSLINLGTGVLADFGGVARFKTVVDDLKREAVQGPPGQPGAKRGVIMVSSGDNFLAGPVFSASLTKGVPFYDTIAMDEIGYTAVAIGNHDFDFGPDVLADFISGYSATKPPYVSANLDFSGEPNLQVFVDRRRIAGSVIVKEKGEQIGIIGATTPALSFISSPRNVIVDEDVAGAINAEVAKLQARKVNKIILISHLQSIQEDLALAPMLNGVDVMVAGGGDEVLANPGDLLVPGDESIIFGPYPLYATDMDGTQVPVVTTAGNYGYVGRLAVGFDKSGNVLMVDDSVSGPVRVAGGANPDAVPPDPVVQAEVVDPVVAAIADLAANIIGTSEVDLDGIRNNIRTIETNEGNLVADSLLWQATELAASFGVPAPDVALQNGGGIRNDSIIPAGNISELDTFSIVPFPNFVSVVENISREQFKEILENAVSRVEFVDGRFAQIAGFSFVWDPAGTPQLIDLDGNITQAGTRVREVSLNDGTVIVSNGAVVAGPAINVATIDFLARGGDQYPFMGAPFTTLGVTYQQALRSYIETGLNGLITAADYPFGGEGRITRLP